MKQLQGTLGPATLLVVDGAVLAFAGPIIGGFIDVTGAWLIGLLALLTNLVAAFFAVRQGAIAGLGKVTIAVILAADAVLLAVCGLYIGHADDAPGAALIGFVLLLANLAAAAVVVRRRGAN